MSSLKDPIILVNVKSIEKRCKQLHYLSSPAPTPLPNGARNSTFMRCALGTSSRVLRMLTESGDVIRYVFLLSAGRGIPYLALGVEANPNSLSVGVRQI